MKTIKLLSALAFALFIIISCSSDDSDPIKSLPKKFDIKLEIKGTGSSPKSLISINGSVIKQWEYINIPFEGKYVYNTTGEEILNSSCNCITISAWVYLSNIYELETFNLFIDGELVDATTTISPPTSNGIMTPTTLEFVYNP